MLFPSGIVMSCCQGDLLRACATQRTFFPICSYAGLMLTNQPSFYRSNLLTMLCTHAVARDWHCQAAFPPLWSNTWNGFNHQMKQKVKLFDSQLVASPVLSQHSSFFFWSLTAPVITVSIFADGNIKFHFIIGIIWLRFSQIPLDSRSTQHDSTIGKKKDNHKPYPFNSQDLISNSPNCLSYSSCDVSLENLVLDQLMIP